MKKNSFLMYCMLFAVCLSLHANNINNPHIDDEECNNSFALANNSIVTTGSVWSYNDTGVDLGSTWKDTSYDASAWATGNAAFGYNDGIIATTLDFGTDSNNKNSTYYLRHEFQIVDASIYGDLILNIMKDDGVVVYLNGVEVSRLNMPTGPITYSTYASSTVGGSDETSFTPVTISNTLQNGTNVLAVELHQADASSSDLIFDMELNFEIPPLSPASFPLAKGAIWNYFDEGTSLDNTGWNNFPYNYDNWSRGYATLGYGDVVDTEISFGPDANDKFITTYFTRDINIDLADLENIVEFGLKRDDGAVVYVNGVEVIRDNMPQGTIDYQTHSSSIVSGGDENTYFVHNVPKTAFQNGVNRIAIELHNRDGFSSDLAFDMFIQNEFVSNFDCSNPHIGCFTSIVPTAQQSHMIIPQEHRFQMIFKQGDAYMDGSGNNVPGNNDFTGYVPINGSSELGYVAVNHETTPGGVSILDVNFNDQTLLWEVSNTQAVDFSSSNVVTTVRNCSGGVTPWGTVVTAEESTNTGDANNDGYEDVGWLVEINPATAEVVDYGNGQEKLWAMGRMKHENVVVSDDSTTAYYGEDGGTDCVYKYVMDTPGDLSAGTLYVLVLDAPLVNNDPTSTTAQWIQVPNTTTAERNNVTTAAAALGGTNFNGVEDCEISPLDGKVYFTAKGKSRTYRFTDNGSTVADFETFVGGMSYEISSTQGSYTEPWGGGNDNLTFDDKGNLWVLQDGGNNYIWVVRPDHTQTTPNVELFASMPAGSEPTGLTFTPDFKYGFFSVQHPSGSNSAQQDATFSNVTFNASATVVFALNENLGAQTPVSDFMADEVLVEEGDVVTFTDLTSNNPTAWEWTFEGGTPATSTDENPMITYDTEGIYSVTLKTTNVAGNNEVIKTDYIVVEDELSAVNHLKDIVSIYPNPTQGNVFVGINDVSGQDIEIQVFDLLGRKVTEVNGMQTTGSKQEIRLDFTEFSSSDQLYIVEVKIGNKTARYKVLKSN